ncbi:hypothetical protein PUN28_015613 [Cardiocondyla obscurior]|uniref:Uncharacterized protein n=1 Tax=Cardiocondyla obscurior TaxID=286306 RepID=A0AAW2EXS4_9HYME
MLQLRFDPPGRARARSLSRWLTQDGLRAEATRYYTRGNGGQREKPRQRLSAIEDSSLAIKGVWWINRGSANISRIKAPSTVRDAVQKRMGWRASNGKIEAKLTSPTDEHPAGRI